MILLITCYLYIYSISFTSEMEQNFTKEDIINLMKKTKKTDPLFKPLKKLKTAVENIGIQTISFLPTDRVIAFHFGLGNDLDKQFLLATKVAKLKQNITIIPGHSYCILNFENAQVAQQFMQSKNILYDKPIYFKEVQYQNLTRTLLFIYCKENLLSETSIVQVPNCPLVYEDNLIPGLNIVQNIIDKEEQAELLLRLDQGNWQKLNNRRVQHYGYQFKYGANQIDKQDQKGIFPQFFDKVLKKIYKLNILKDLHFDQLTINDYFAGNGIPAHFDTHSPFQEIFISVSMLSGIVMQFKRFDGQERSVRLRERSLAIFSGQARYAWTHAIASRKMDKIENKLVHRSRRVSLTFRKIKFNPCQCSYYFYCDSQGYDQQTMKKNNPLLTKFLSENDQKQLQKYNSSQIERQFVDKAYNSFGFDFHNKVIEQVRQYLTSDVSSGDIILDIGCGNGQYKKWIREDSHYLCVQKCRMMVQVENEFYMDCVRLCFRQNSFEKVLLVAVLHHLASEEKRLKALVEIHRILKVDGIGYISVLNYENKRQVYSSPEIFLEYCLPANKFAQKQKYIEKIFPIKKNQKLNQQSKGLTQEDLNGLNMQNGRKQARGEIYKRYYHLFTYNQLESLILKAGLKIVQGRLTKQNIIIKVTKSYYQPQT